MMTGTKYNRFLQEIVEKLSVLTAFDILFNSLPKPCTEMSEFTCCTSDVPYLTLPRKSEQNKSEKIIKPTRILLASHSENGHEY